MADIIQVRVHNLNKFIHTQHLHNINNLLKLAGAKWPSARWQSGVPGTEKDIRQSIRPDIPMSPKASSVSDEADTLDAFGLISMVNY